MTEEWFYSSLSTQDWVDPVPFLHARHSGQQLARGLNKAQRIFLNTRFFVGHSSNPSQIFLETALSASGGSIADSPGSSDYLIFGTCLVCILTLTYLFEFRDECVTLYIVSVTLFRLFETAVQRGIVFQLMSVRCTPFSRLLLSII